MQILLLCLLCKRVVPVHPPKSQHMLRTHAATYINIFIESCAARDYRCSPKVHLLINVCLDTPSQLLPQFDLPEVTAALASQLVQDAWQVSLYLFLPSYFHAVFIFYGLFRSVPLFLRRLSSSGDVVSDEIPLLRAETVAMAKSVRTHAACIARYVAYSLWVSDVLNWFNNFSF